MNKRWFGMVVLGLLTSSLSGCISDGTVTAEVALKGSTSRCVTSGFDSVKTISVEAFGPDAQVTASADLDCRAPTFELSLPGDQYLLVIEVFARRPGESLAYSARTKEMTVTVHDGEVLDLGRIVINI